ncbi:MAG: DUF389 domain-containing protein [Flavobacteriaceae bacterium]|nr:DUF389 domain-containing protein [Flavobacteriaceae bacterium]
MEDKNQLEGQEPKKEGNPIRRDNMKQNAQGLFQEVKDFLIDLVNIKDETDKPQTIEDIKKDIPFKGHTVWILICSIFIASFGLNANSVAVVIGAMLISPLMGPILGIGMALALNDIDTLKRSLINFGVMVGVSVLTASFFFWAFPLKSETSELLARTAPDIRDVFIAFFGGLALVIAKSKKGTIAGVIFGVAIATALMPPLCTAGYGIGIGKLEYTKGAMYLFMINTVFIALATFVVLKILRFPMVKYANSTKRKRIAQFASIIAILFMVPAIMTFIDVYKKSKFETDYKNFILDEIKNNKSLMLLDDNGDYEKKIIELDFYGNLPDETKADLKNEKLNYESLKDIEIFFKDSNSADDYELVKDLLEEKRDEVKDQRKEIETLEQTIDELRNKLAAKDGQKPFDFLGVSKDARIKFSELQYLTFSNELRSDFVKIDTISVVRPVWHTSVTDSTLVMKNQELSDWLKGHLKTEVEVKYGN